MLLEQRRLNMPIVYLALGSNLNRPRRQLSTAFKSLRNLPRTQVDKYSSIYLTKPWGLKAQSNYYNVVVAIKTQLSPQSLFYYCKKIEQKQRRIHKKIWGSRSIDIDILLYDQVTINQKNFKIPHTQIMNRDFVIIPLLELSPEQCLPDGKKIALNPDIPETIIKIC